MVGDVDGDADGKLDGEVVGSEAVGDTVGEADGEADGEVVGEELVGIAVGAHVTPQQNCEHCPTNALSQHTLRLAISTGHRLTGTPATTSTSSSGAQVGDVVGAAVGETDGAQVRPAANKLQHIVPQASAIERVQHSTSAFGRALHAVSPALLMAQSMGVTLGAGVGDVVGVAVGGHGPIAQQVRWQLAMTRLSPPPRQQSRASSAESTAVQSKGAVSLNRESQTVVGARVGVAVGVRAAQQVIAHRSCTSRLFRHMPLAE